MLDIKFANPANLYYLLPLTGVLLIVVLIRFILNRWRKSARPFRAASHLLRLFALGLLAVSLASPYLQHEESQNNAYILIDISDSNGESESQALLERAASLFKDGKWQLEVSAFAGKIGAIGDGIPGDYHNLKNQQASLNIGETNIEQALQQTLSSSPGSILLISDGNETKGDVKELFSLFNAHSSKIFPIVPEAPAQIGEAFKISELYVPLTAPSEKSVDIKVSLINGTPRTQSGILEVKHGEKVVLTQRVSLEAGREKVITAQSDPSKEGIKEIRATLKPENQELAGSSRIAYLSGEEREKVMLVSGERSDNRFLQQLLESQAYKIDSMVAAEQRPHFEELQRYSVIILNNVPLRALPEGAAAQIESYVREGGGLIMIGGDRSFGLGGYKNSRIEDALPVDMVPPQTVEKRLNVAMQLVIDKSRSMAAGRRLDFAKESALEVINNLKNEDFVGVMGFDENPFVVIRLDQVAKIRNEAARRVSMLWPKGGTSLIGAIDEARRDLMRVNAGRKHMLILSDGEVTDLPRTTYYELIKQARLIGITISTVMLGNDGDDSMFREMANLGGGKFYATNDARALPKIFVSDVKVASGEETMREESSFAVKIGESNVLSTDITSYPRLRGYVQTKAKSRANLELEAIGAQRSDPLLVSWKYGQGKSIAYTSDVNGRWSNSWIDWPKMQKFWSDLVDSLRPDGKVSEPKIPFDLVHYYEKGELHLELILYSSSDGAAVTAQVLKPDGSTQKVTFEAAARGRYKATIDNPTAGKFELRGTVGHTPLTPVAFQLSGDLFGERKGEGYNTPLLEQLASRSGGIVNPRTDQLKNQIYITVEKQELNIYFILAALIILLIEILWRESAFSTWRRRKNTISTLPNVT